MTEPARATTDPDGRLVVFDAGSALHLSLGGRDWLLDHVELILGAVAVPDYREEDPRPGRERFYRQNALATERWLYSGPPSRAYASPEGHGVEYDASGRIIALTLVNVRWLLERDGELTITWPTGHVGADDLANALAPAA